VGLWIFSDNTFCTDVQDPGLGQDILDNKVNEHSIKSF
jgi:hypothetical protein